MTTKTIARISGVGYLIIFITGFYSNFAVVESLVDLSNATLTFENLFDNPDQLFLGIMGFMIMITFDAVLVLTLYQLLKSVSKSISLVSASFRLINVIFFGVALSKMLMIFKLIAWSGTDPVSPDQIMDLIISFNETWIVGLIFFGIHLALLGYLALKSLIFPKWIGVLLILAAIGYITDGMANLYLSSYEAYKNVFMLIVVVPGVLGEFSFTLWLLFKREFTQLN